MDRPSIDVGSLTCPLPLSNSAHVLLGHGSGGKLSADLIQQVFVAGYGNEILAALEDQATLTLPPTHAPLRLAHSAKFPLPVPAPSEHADEAALDEYYEQRADNPRIAFTTDAFVVRPLFFPGGDIGRLAVHGTVNDLAVGGAIPLYLSAAFILEEGLPLDDLRRIVASMHQACKEADVTLVTGDTKVVDRGKGDGVYITTSGVGLLPQGRALSVRNARAGDAVIVSGTLGDHGMAIMSVREGIEFETVLQSDSASLNGLTETMLGAVPGLRWMRDPTRGGLSSALNELAQGSRVGVRIEESTLPIRPEVRAACELLGLDPLYVANEGKLVAVVPRQHVGRLLDAMRGHPLGRDSALIGEIVDDHPGLVLMKSVVGGERVVTMLAGEQLPRIC